MTAGGRRDRFAGCLLGLAVGDAVGTSVEFAPPGTFEPIRDMIGGGPFELLPGEWTDDTSMALCLADSLLKCEGFDALDQMQRYRRWRHDGYRSSNGVCFDVGGTVAAALGEFERSGNAFAGPTEPRTAGNGSLMRLAPVPMYWSGDPAAAVFLAAESSRVTHGAPESVDACRWFASIVVGALAGEPREVLLASGFSPAPRLWENRPLSPAVEEVAGGSYARREPPEIRGSGYVVRSLEAALWAFAKARDFRHGCLLAANLGDDADTTAAIYGQLAGALFGASGIPEEWLERLAFRDEIQRVAMALMRGPPQNVSRT